MMQLTTYYTAMNYPPRRLSRLNPHCYT